MAALTRSRTAEVALSTRRALAILKRDGQTRPIAVTRYLTPCFARKTPGCNRLRRTAADRRGDTLLGDTAAVTALLDCPYITRTSSKCGPRSWRTKVAADLRAEAPAK